MAISHDQILSEVSRATNQLILKEVFYGHFFVGMIKEVTERVPTMAVGPAGTHVKLHINPRFWTTQLPTDDLRYGLIKHEVLHVVLKHIFRGKEYANKPLYNIACDLVINQYILERQLPPNRIHLGLFPDMGLEPEQDSDYYYRKLLDLYHAHSGRGGGKGEPGDGETGKGEDEGQSGEAPDGGKSGQGSQEQQDHAPENGSGGERGQDQDSGQNREQKQDQDEPEGSESWENLKKILGEDNEWQERHAVWEEVEELPSALRDVLEQSVDQMVLNTVDKAKRHKDWGQLPAGLRAYLEEFEQRLTPVVNWRRALRMFAESSSRTYLKNTIKRPSKRYGTSPGIKIRRRHKLLVALDTSGSITHQELSEFFGEVYHIWKRGAEVMVVECDAEIGAKYLYTGKVPATITGRGGTNFTPPVIWANTDYHPDAIIYFTDGLGPAPSRRSRCPIMWLISSEGVSPDSAWYQALPGFKVKMNPS